MYTVSKTSRNFIVISFIFQNLLRKDFFFSNFNVYFIQNCFQSWPIKRGSQKENTRKSSRVRGPDMIRTCRKIMSEPIRTKKSRKGQGQSPQLVRRMPSHSELPPFLIPSRRGRKSELRHHDCLVQFRLNVLSLP